MVISLDQNGVNTLWIWVIVAIVLVLFALALCQAARRDPPRPPARQRYEEQWADEDFWDVSKDDDE